MAILQDHLALASSLRSDMHRAQDRGEWPIAVDAGFYTVFHTMEAVNALECRDTYSFADAADILETILIERGLGETFASDYRYLFYFRRGVLYGAHVPTHEQMVKYIDCAVRSADALMAYLEKAGVKGGSVNQVKEAVH